MKIKNHNQLPSSSNKKKKEVDIVVVDVVVINVIMMIKAITVVTRNGKRWLVVSFRSLELISKTLRLEKILGLLQAVKVDVIGKVENTS